MRFLLVLLLVVAFGCDRASEKAAEIASGGKVKIDGDKVTIQTEDGTATIDRKGDKTVVVTEDGKKATITSDGDVAQIKTKEGTFTTGKNEVPKGFPLKVLPGSKVVHAAHSKPASGDETFQVMTSSPAAVAKVGAFYEKALKDKGLEVKRSEMKLPQGQQWVLHGKADKIEAMVMVARQKGKNETTATVVWRAKP